MFFKTENKIFKNKYIYILVLIFVITLIIIYISKEYRNKSPLPQKDKPIYVNNDFLDNQVLAVDEKINIPKEVVVNSEKYKIVNRSVVIPENILNKKKVVLLTIDDGPSSRTKEIINILNKHNAKGIFFINGMHEKGYPNVIADIVKEGHVVGNHTWNHLNLKKEKNLKIIESEINKNTELINKLTGSNPRFFRAPYGESNAYIRELVKDDGMLFMDWSGAALDWDKSTIEKDIFIGNVMKNIHSGSIILIHEHPWSVANLDSLLTTIESEGYTYVNPSDIIE